MSAHGLREALTLALLLSLPVLASALLATLVVSALQLVTRLSDPTIAAILRLLTVTTVLLIIGGWIGNRLVVFTARTLETIASIH